MNITEYFLLVVDMEKTILDMFGNETQHLYFSSANNGDDSPLSFVSVDSVFGSINSGFQSHNIIENPFAKSDSFKITYPSAFRSGNLSTINIYYQLKELNESSGISFNLTGKKATIYKCSSVFAGAFWNENYYQDVFGNNLKLPEPSIFTQKDSFRTLKTLIIDSPSFSINSISHELKNLDTRLYEEISELEDNAETQNPISYGQSNQDNNNLFKCSHSIDKYNILSLSLSQINPIDTTDEIVFYLWDKNFNRYLKITSPYTINQAKTKAIFNKETEYTNTQFRQSTGYYILQPDELPTTDLEAETYYYLGNEQFAAQSNAELFTQYNSSGDIFTFSPPVFSRSINGINETHEAGETYRESTKSPDKYRLEVLETLKTKSIWIPKDKDASFLITATGATDELLSPPSIPTAIGYYPKVGLTSPNLNSDQNSYDFFEMGKIIIFPEIPMFAGSIKNGVLKIAFRYQYRSLYKTWNDYKSDLDPRVEDITNPLYLSITSVAGSVIKVFNEFPKDQKVFDLEINTEIPLDCNLDDLKAGLTLNFPLGTWWSNTEIAPKELYNGFCQLLGCEIVAPMTLDADLDKIYRNGLGIYTPETGRLIETGNRIVKDLLSLKDLDDTSSETELCKLSGTFTNPITLQNAIQEILKDCGAAIYKNDFDTLRIKPFPYLTDEPFIVDNSKIVLSSNNLPSLDYSETSAQDIYTSYILYFDYNLANKQYQSKITIDRNGWTFNGTTNINLWTITNTELEEITANCAKGYDLLGYEKEYTYKSKWIKSNLETINPIETKLLSLSRWYSKPHSLINVRLGQKYYNQLEILQDAKIVSDVVPQIIKNKTYIIYQKQIIPETINNNSLPSFLIKMVEI